MDAYGRNKPQAFLPLMMLYNSLCHIYHETFVRSFVIFVSTSGYSSWAANVKRYCLNHSTIPLLDADMSLGFNDRLPDPDFDEIIK